MPKKRKHKNLKPPGKCIFCNEGDLSHEEIYAEWLQRELPRTGDMTKHSTRMWIGSLQLSEKIRKITGPPLVRRLRVVCKTCNNGWMSRLQTKAKPILLPLVLGNWSEIGEAHQEILATWAVMTTMVFERADPGTDAHTFEDRKTFKENNTPPRGWTIWAGKINSVEWSDQIDHWGLSASMHDRTNFSVPAATQCNFQSTSIGIGSFVFHTISAPYFLEMNTYPTLVDQFASTHGLRVIWPPRGSIHGPPRTLSSSEIKAMSTAIIAHLYKVNGLIPPKALNRNSAER